MNLDEIKKEIIRVGRFLIEKDLTVGSSGNISVRIPEENKIVITPSMIPFVKMTIEDLLVLDPKGDVIEGERNPSIETSLHLKIYEARKDINAIIHAHTIYASAFAVARKRIPPILDELIVYTGGEVEVADYALPGSEELAENVLKALGNKKAVLLANHGLVACGRDLEDALDVLLKVERTARIFILTKVIGEPHTLPKESIEMEQEFYEALNLL